MRIKIKHVLLFLFILFLQFGKAQDEPGSLDSLENQSYDFSEITLMAEKDNVKLLKLRNKYAEKSTLINSILEGLPGLIESNNKVKAFTDTTDLAQMPRKILENVIIDLDRNKLVLSGWNNALMKKVVELETEREDLKSARKLWNNTYKAAREQAIPNELLKRIRSVEKDFKEVDRILFESLKQTLVLQDDIIENEIFISNLQNKMDEIKASFSTGLFLKDAPAIWELFKPREDTTAAFNSSLVIIEWSWSFSRFWNISKNNFSGYVLFALLFLAFALFLKKNKGKFNLPDLPSGNAYLIFIDHPVQTTFLLFCFLFFLIFPLAPPTVSESVLILSVFPIITLSGFFLLSKKKMILYVLSGLLIVSIVLNDYFYYGTLGRFSILAFAIFAAIIIFVTSRRTEYFKEFGLAKRSVREFIRWQGPIALFLLGISVFVNLLGYKSFSGFLAYKVIQALYFSLVFYILIIFMKSAVIIFSHSRLAARLFMFQNHRVRVTNFLLMITEYALFFTWLFVVMSLFEIWTPIFDSIESFLTTKHQYGSFSLTFGSIIFFFIVIWISIVIARLISFMMGEEVLLHFKVSRSISYTFSLLLKSVLIAVGFFIALSITGINLSEISILMGAFGVGIGFGMQNIFNNLMSGLILIFERSIKIGDMVEIGSSLGEVKSISLRASVILTLDGAEIVVPNGKLISEELINWTLSAGYRRVEVPLGVAYGTDPHKVIEIIEEVAHQHPDVIDFPKPDGNFTGFGESSLDFLIYFWITDILKINIIKSDIALQIHDKLKEAGITIPFPQRDLYIKELPDGGKKQGKGK
jgi:potassium-dependent mechanosensitive channel